MEPNPYEAPQADQKQKPLPDGKNSTGNPAGAVLALGCLMLPACFIAFFCVCNATGPGIGAQYTDWDLAPAFAAAALVAFAFICAIVMTLKRSRRD